MIAMIALRILNNCEILTRRYLVKNEYLNKEILPFVNKAKAINP